MRRAAIVVVVALSAAGVATTSGGVSARSSGTIVFESTRSGQHEIYSVRADGHGLRRLTITVQGLTRRERDAMWPRWAPDGKRIVFQIGRKRCGSAGRSSS